MTLHLSRKPGARSSQQTLAGGDVKAAERVSLAALVPPPIRSSGPEDPTCQINVGHGVTVATEVTHDIAFADEANSSHTLWLTRDKAAGYLSSLGYPITAQRLAKLAVSGDGPEYRRWGNRALYDPTLLMKWAKNRESTPGRTAQDPMA